LRSVAASSGGQSLVVDVDGVAHQTGIARAVSGSQPGDDGTLSVRLEQVLFDSLVNWVENGVAPDKILASGGAVPKRTRPLCPYPRVARYKGKGSIDEAANFDCRLP
jgi:hypothetical protein